jgi:hypothetical protein
MGVRTSDIAGQISGREEKEKWEVGIRKAETGKDKFPILP